MATTIRDYRPGDQGAAYFVCLKTGNQGDDGEPFYKEDPDALGRIFVGPYLRFEPGLALMLEDEQGVCGYASGRVRFASLLRPLRKRVAAGALLRNLRSRRVIRRVGRALSRSTISTTTRTTTCRSRMRTFRPTCTSTSWLECTGRVMEHR